MRIKTAVTITVDTHSAFYAAIVHQYFREVCEDPIFTYNGKVEIRYLRESNMTKKEAAEELKFIATELRSKIPQPNKFEIRITQLRTKTADGIAYSSEEKAELFC